MISLTAIDILHQKVFFSFCFDLKKLFCYPGRDVMVK
jgi:hypothetical protein